MPHALEFNFHPLHKNRSSYLTSTNSIDITTVGDTFFDDDDMIYDIHLLENDRISKGLIRYIHINPTA